MVYLFSILMSFFPTFVNLYFSFSLTSSLSLIYFDYLIVDMEDGSICYDGRWQYNGVNTMLN